MKKLFTLFAAFLITVSIVNAQGIALGATAGLTVVTSPDSWTKDISEGGLGFSKAPHFGVKGRFSLPLIPISITGQVLYTSFSAEGDYPNLPSVSVERKMSMLIFGVGAEYKLVPGPISPYAAFDLFYTNFSELENSYSSSVAGASGNNDGFSRTGIGLGAGLQIGIVPLIDIDVSAKYNINNLIGKEDGEDTISTLNLSATVFFGF